jgi:hypothetical protein
MVCYKDMRQEHRNDLNKEYLMHYNAVIYTHQLWLTAKAPEEHPQY